MTVLLVFAIGLRLANKWVGLLGAAFYAFAVLPIQLSHFATVDTVTNTFAYLAIWAAIWALTRLEPKFPEDQSKLVRIFSSMAPYLLFGVPWAQRLPQINAVVVALVLPLVEWVRIRRMNEEQREKGLLLAVRNVAVAAVVSFLVFRIGQPYASTAWFL